MLRKLIAIAVLVTSIATCNPVPAHAAGVCHAVEDADVTVCVSVTSNSATQKGRVFKGDEDQFGVVKFGISMIDTDCRADRNGDRMPRRNCKVNGRVGPDFITPFYDYSAPNWAICGVERLLTTCGGRSLKEGLQYVVGFDSPQGMFAVHRGPSGLLGESHGCVRASTTVAEFIFDEYAAGSSVALVILDKRMGN